MMSTPITFDAFAEQMANLGLAPSDGPFAVAVSGGPDSMALALLFAAWGDATCLTFDHGLRPDSADEAKQVAEWLQAKGLHPEIMTWWGEKPKADIQAAARAARYRALEGWCVANKVKYLFLAHTKDDQAETFLMRLIRGSGVDGLAAMSAIAPPVSIKDGPALVRPLLDVDKTQLLAFLKAKGQDFIQDPSNENEAFLRVQVRKLLAESGIEGFTIETLAKTSKRMGRARRVLQDLSGELLKSAFIPYDEGYSRLDVSALMTAPEEIGLRALSRAVMVYGGGRYPPRLDKLERLYHALKKKDFSGATLAGCQILKAGEDSLFFCRETADISETQDLNPGETVIWDRRFEVSLDKAAEPGTICALGEGGWAKLVKDNPALKEFQLPYPVKTGLPAFFAGDGILEVPHLHVPNKNAWVNISMTSQHNLF